MTIPTCFIHTLYRFDAFSGTNLLTRCRSASSCFLLFLVSEILVTKYSRNWTKSTPRVLFCHEASRRPKRRRSGATRWGHSRAAGRPTGATSRDTLYRGKQCCHGSAPRSSGNWSGIFPGHRHRPRQAGKGSYSSASPHRRGAVLRSFRAQLRRGGRRVSFFGALVVLQSCCFYLVSDLLQSGLLSFQDAGPESGEEGQGRGDRHRR